MAVVESRMQDLLGFSWKRAGYINTWPMYAISNSRICDSNSKIP